MYRRRYKFSFKHHYVIPNLKRFIIYRKVQSALFAGILKNLYQKYSFSEYFSDNIFNYCSYTLSADFNIC